jgi:hypothetical protein
VTILPHVITRNLESGKGRIAIGDQRAQVAYSTVGQTHLSSRDG